MNAITATVKPSTEPPCTSQALALHWADVDLEQRMLFVRYTLSNINNTTPVFTSPKARSSHAWIGLSDRALAALRRQADRNEQRNSS